MVFDSISAIIMIFILMAVGYLISKAKWYSESAQVFISKLVLNVTLPCTIVVAFLKNFTPEIVGSYAPAFLVVICSTVATYFLGKIFARVLKLKRNRIGIFTMLVAVSNCGFIGFPLSQIMFGDEGVILTVLFFMTQNILINSVGFVEISRDGDAENKPGKKEILKRLFNPLILTTIASLTICMCGVSLDMLPGFISKTLTLIDGITAPLSLVFIGMVMGAIGIRNLTPRKGMPTLFILRFLAAPAITMLFCLLFKVDNYTATVFLILSALPSMVQVSIMAKNFGANVKYAVSCIFYTTLISLAAIPLYSILATCLFG